MLNKLLGYAYLPTQCSTEAKELSFAYERFHSSCNLTEADTTW